MTEFLLGFLCAFALSAGAAVAYYVRAYRRVQSIRRKIEEYRSATSTVGEVCDKVFK